VQIAIVKRSFLGDPHCGDACAYWQGDGEITLCVVDGLGHGRGAEKAARAALDYVAQHVSEPLPDIFAGCDLAIGTTRGVVMGIAVVDERMGTLTYAGVGNPRLLIVRAHRSRPDLESVIRLSNRPGIVGGGCGKVSPETVPLGLGDLVILCTDGIPGGMDIAGYEDALTTDVRQLAERIVQDWGRVSDDVAVLVFRNEGERDPPPVG
jgi:negative regulator of sigma-B (phosphoserine phosphatase)